MSEKDNLRHIKNLLEIVADDNATIARQLQEIMRFVHGAMYDVRAGANDDYMPDDYDADRAAIDAWLRKELSAE